MAKKAQQEDYAQSLSQEFDQWERYYTHGGQDPFWADGVNLNLIRNHIFYYKHKIEETMKPSEYPNVYYRDEPPEVDPRYMARTDEIRKNAAASLERYLADPDYKFLCRRVESINPKQAKQICIRNVINYAQGLYDAIKRDDLVTMRRHERAEGYLKSFASCAEKVRNLKPPENEQLSMFGSYDGDEEEDEEELEW
ncbi:MAG: hypothetical protein LBN43_08210 [Oscillospiraceae bacterium]|nr:hypothetical protein [Oscillospiraceae bacterium]